jgi:SAM-dependent methyltransferase
MREVAEPTDASIAVPEKVTFSFGRNWQAYVSHHLTAQREQNAINSMAAFLEIQDLKGRIFLDIGCGSGLFSLGALRMGARQIISLDVDMFSVQACEGLKRNAGNPANWEVLHGSILDDSFLSKLPKADVVYAWGSLHHTGHMWQAIRNAAGLVEKNGLFYFSIYNKVTGRRGSESWLKVKRWYNRSPWLGKRLLESLYFLRYGLLSKLASFQNPSTLFTEYSQGRGMSYWIDVRDWLGGYPYEFASVDEIFLFCSRVLGMEMVNIKATNTTGTHEFLFRRRV